MGGLYEREEGEPEMPPGGREDWPLLFSLSVSSVVGLLLIQFKSLLCLCLFHAHKLKEMAVKRETVEGLDS